MSGAVSDAVRRAVNESIQASITKSINDAIKEGITKSVSDAVSSSIQKGIREQLQKGILKNTDNLLREQLNTTLKKSLNDNIEGLANSRSLSQYFSTGQLNDANFTRLVNDFQIPKSTTDDLVNSAKNAGKDMAEVPSNIVTKAEDLRKAVGEGNIRQTDELVDLNKAADDIANDTNLNKTAKTEAEIKSQADDFVKKNGNKKYKTAAGLILGSVLAIYVLDRMNDKATPRGIRHLEKAADKELKITYVGDSFNFCNGDELNITVTPANIVTTQSGGVNGDYTTYEDLKNNQVKIPTTSNITTVPSAPAPENSSYGQVKVNTSFVKETVCTVKDGVTGLVKAAGDITGLSGVFAAIKKFIPYVVGIIILIILFKLWSYFKSSPATEIKLSSPTARYYYR